MMQHVMNERDSHEHLLERILSSENMHRAWTRVKKNKGAAGVDKRSIDEMPDYLHEHWAAVRESLMEGKYQPSPGLAGGDPETVWWCPLTGHPDSAGSADSTGDCPGPDRDLRSGFFGAQLRVQAGALRSRCGLSGAGVYQTVVHHRRGRGP